MTESGKAQNEDLRRHMRRDAAPVALLTLGLGMAAAMLLPFGSRYTLVFTMNVSMVTFALTVLMFHRYRDWHILPLCLLYFWHTLQLTCAAISEVMTAGLPDWLQWLMEHPLVVPSLLGFAVVVYLWRVFQIQASLQEREKQLTDRIQQAQKLESLGIMAGGIAHDFSNLLTVIIGNATLLRMDAEGNSEAARHAQEILTSAERAADISRQMLNYTGCGKFTIKRLTMRTLVEGSRQMIESYIPSGVSLVVTHAETGNAGFDGDASQLGQLLINLVTNAAEATGGKGTIAIRTDAIEADDMLLARGVSSDALRPGTYALLYVEDDGEGMSAETITRMFDPFFSKRTIGRGMGLAAALGIVRGHHGTILVESEVGKGSQIWVLLPMAEHAATKPLPPKQEQ